MVADVDFFSVQLSANKLRGFLQAVLFYLLWLSGTHSSSIHLRIIPRPQGQEHRQEANKMLPVCGNKVDV